MNNLLSKQEMSTQQLSMVQSEFDKKKRSKGVMYLLWFFFGGVGGHRYYLGDVVYAVFMTLTLGGFGIWSLIDLFLIGGRLDKKNEEIESDIIQNVKLYSKANEAQ